MSNGLSGTMPKRKNEQLLDTKFSPDGSENKTPPDGSEDAERRPDGSKDETPPSDIVFTAEHAQALQHFEEGKNILITGPAGTGKTTLLREIIRRCTDKGCTLLQTGPTGVSALQLPNGKTLHSALKIPVGSFPTAADLELYYLKLWQKNHNKKSNKGNEWFHLVRSCDVMIVDEVSMVSVYMLEVIDIALGILRECRHKPMGGLQMIFVGDFMQLPPVYVRKDKSVPPTQGQMAFKSSVWTALHVQTVLLTKIFRQENEEFARMLNIIRNGQDLKGDAKVQLDSLMNRTHTYPGQPLFICYKKFDVSHINQMQLDKLNASRAERHQYRFPYMTSSLSKEHEEEMIKMIRENLNMASDVTHQTFYRAMRVMLVRNTTLDQLKLINGDTGVIVGFEYPPNPVEATSAKPLTMAQNTLNSLHARYKGQNFATTRFPMVRFDRFPQVPIQILPTFYQRQEIDPADGEMIIRVEVDTLPLIASWAITSHRCQGSTIANIPVTINADCMHFCEGSFYVAMSRCKQFEQLSIVHYKGYCQNKEAYGFYQGFLTLPQPKQYSKSNEANMEVIQQRLQPKEPKDDDVQPKKTQLKQKSKDGVSGVSSDIPSVKPMPKTLEDMKQTWDNELVPHLNQFCANYEHIDKKSIATIRWLEAWIKQRKTPCHVQSTLETFLTKK